MKTYCVHFRSWERTNACYQQLIRECINDPAAVSTLKAHIRRYYVYSQPCHERSQRSKKYRCYHRPILPVIPHSSDSCCFQAVVDRFLSLNSVNVIMQRISNHFKINFCVDVCNLRPVGTNISTFVGLRLFCAVEMCQKCHIDGKYRKLLATRNSTAEFKLYLFSLCTLISSVSCT